MEQTSVVKFNKQKVGDMAKRLPTTQSRVGLWKNLLTSGISGMFKINLSSVVCFIPLIAVLYMYIAATATVSSSLPFSSYILGGYPTIVDASAKAFTMNYAVMLQYLVLLMPAALFVSLFLSLSVQYAMRNFVWTEGNFQIKTLFKSFKFNWLQGLIISFITSALAMGVMYVVYVLVGAVHASGWTAINVIALIVICIVAIILAIVSMYAFSISLTYKEKLHLVYRDAFALTFKLILQNILVTIVSYIPIALLAALYSTTWISFGMMIFIFIGFSFMMLTWTVYSQYVFDLATKKLGGKSAYQGAPKKA